MQLEVTIALICTAANSQQPYSVLFDPGKGAVKGICFLIKILFSLPRQKSGTSCIQISLSKFHELRTKSFSSALQCNYHHLLVSFSRISYSGSVKAQVHESERHLSGRLPSFRRHCTSSRWSIDNFINKKLICIEPKQTYIGRPLRNYFRYSRRCCGCE